MPFTTEETAWKAAAHVAFQQSKLAWLGAREAEEEAVQTERQVWLEAADFIKRLEKEALKAERQSQKRTAKEAKMEARTEAKKTEQEEKRLAARVARETRWQNKIEAAKARWHAKFDGRKDDNCNMPQMQQ